MASYFQPRVAGIRSVLAAPRAGQFQLPQFEGGALSANGNDGFPSNIQPPFMHRGRMRPPLSSKPCAFDGHMDRPRRHAQAPSAGNQRERPVLMGLKGLAKTRVHPGPPAPPSSPVAEPSADSEDLCEIDRTILRHLQANGRMPNVALAELLNLPPSSVHKRIRRLQERRFILRFEAVLDPAKLRSGLLAYVQVQMEGADENAHDNFRAAMQTCSSVLECHTIANGYDYLLKLRVADVAACTRVLASSVWPVRGVRSTRTFMVMEEIKHSACIGL